MKVAIDVSPLKNANRYRGVGAYTNQLAESLKLLNISDFSFQLIESGKIAKDYNLIHYPFFDPFFLTLPLKKEKPTVVTIHDTIPLVFPEHYPPGAKGNLKFQIQKFSLKNVKAVITDSENSKKDIFKYLNYPKEKIYVIPLAPAKDFKVIKNKDFLDKIKRKYKLPEKFILYVGDVNYNKNVLGLIKAFADFRDQEKDLNFVLVGKAFLEEDLKETQEIIKLINLLDLNKNIIRLGWIPQEDLAGIYNSATVYCQPSFYEGFGLPVLEAMACGCPVVAANTSSLPEICGRAAIMFDPYNIKSIVEGIKMALNQKSDLMAKGLRQVENFNWEKVAQKTYEVYQKVV